MAKKQTTSTKDLKSQIKEIEAKMFGLKNKKQKSTLEKQLEALKIKETELKKTKQKKEIIPIMQKIPVGVDPKTVQCINYTNKCCTEGDKCRFAHEIIKKVDLEKETQEKTVKRVCRFLLDSMNNKEYNRNWVCPFPKCKDAHKLIDLKGDTDCEVSLEEYMELSRQSLNGKLTPLTEETFALWKERKVKEEIEHNKKIEAVQSGVRGLELFESRPDIFMDDEEAGDLDYKDRCYKEDDEEQTVNTA